MTTQFQSNTNKGFVDDFGCLFCDTVFSATLVADTEATVTVLGSAGIGNAAANINKFLAVFTTTLSGAFVALNATAAIPINGTLQATTSEALPLGKSAKQVKAGDVIHVISHVTPGVTIALYAIQE